MFTHVMVGAHDLEASKKFYDAVLGAIGYERGFFDNGWAGYGPKCQDQTVFVCPPFDGAPARGGNGIMIAFKADSTAAVDAAHQAGLANGGTDEGAPGPRPADSTSFYGEYLRDATGNKLCIFTKP